MSRALLPSGIELEYETFGSADDPTLVLVSGLGAQLLTWDPALCERFVAAGRHVVRFDNRDAGLSTWLDEHPLDAAVVAAAGFAGKGLPPVPYTLSEMAADVVGLLDHLGVERAHVAGASMGGMIVQTLAIEHSHRFTSATSIMSTTGNPQDGRPVRAAIDALLAPPPTSRQEAIDLAANWQVYCSRRHWDLGEAQAFAATLYDRANNPAGVTRQLAAIYASGDRTERLREVTVPMLVIHGLDDTLITLSGGRRTAELVPGASLLELADMGHDLPEPLWPMLVAAIVAHGDVAAGAER